MRYFKTSIFTFNKSRARNNKVAITKMIDLKPGVFGLLLVIIILVAILLIWSSSFIETKDNNNISSYIEDFNGSFMNNTVKRPKSLNQAINNRLDRVMGYYPELEEYDQTQSTKYFAGKGPYRSSVFSNEKDDSISHIGNGKLFQGCIDNSDKMNGEDADGIYDSCEIGLTCSSGICKKSDMSDCKNPIECKAESFCLFGVCTPLPPDNENDLDTNNSENRNRSGFKHSRKYKTTKTTKSSIVHHDHSPQRPDNVNLNGHLFKYQDGRFSILNNSWNISKVSSICDSDIPNLYYVVSDEKIKSVVTAPGFYNFSEIESNVKPFKVLRYNGDIYALDKKGLLYSLNKDSGVWVFSLVSTFNDLEVKYLEVKDTITCRSQTEESITLIVTEKSYNESNIKIKPKHTIYVDENKHQKHDIPTSNKIHSKFAGLTNGLVYLTYKNNQWLREMRYLPIAYGEYGDHILQVDRQENRLIYSAGKANIEINPSREVVNGIICNEQREVMVLLSDGTIYKYTVGGLYSIKKSMWITEENIIFPQIQGSGEKLHLTNDNIWLVTRNVDIPV